MTRDNKEARNAHPKPVARERTTTERFTWRGIACSVVHTRDHINSGWSRLNFRILSDKAPPVPITHARYLAHEVDEDDVTAAGGAVPYLVAWLEREACNPGYAKALADWKQLDLFGR